MATANYMTMESFPLFAREFTSEIKCCKHCGLYQDSDNDVCEECGGELEEEMFVDEIEVQETVSDIESVLMMMSTKVWFSTRFPSCLGIIMVSSFMWKPRMTPRRWTTRTADITLICTAA